LQLDDVFLVALIFLQRYLRENNTVVSKYIHEKNDFAEVSKNFSRYRFENNFIELSKLLCSN